MTISNVSSASSQLSSSEKALIARLQARDTTVKAPDEKLYAIGGEVAIDTAPENEPEATVKKMQLVRTAALAPSDPSATDYSVAATASMLQMHARLEISRNTQAKLLNNPLSSYQANTITSSTSFSKYA